MKINLSAASIIGLLNNETKTTSWSQLQPQSPMYLFVPQRDIHDYAEFEKDFKIAEIFLVIK